MIVRGPRPSDNFAQIHNEALADGRLSFKARGILAFLLSRPPGWKTSAERLAKSGIDGERAVKSGLKELEATGYLKRTRSHGPGGQWIHNQVITDQPQILPIGTKRTDGDELEADLATIGTFCTGGKQPDINNTDSNNTYLQEADVVVSPTGGEPTAAPPSRDSELIRDGVESPTPRRLPEKPSRHGWMTDAAWKTAHEDVELVDVAIHATRYTIRCAELKKKPTSPEWLRWLMDDEQQARVEERKQAQTNGRKKKWYSVAGEE